MKISNFEKVLPFQPLLTMKGTDRLIHVLGISLVLLEARETTFAQTNTAVLQCSPIAGAADGIIVQWGPTPAAQGDSATFPVGTNFVINDVDLSTPEFFKLHCFASNVNVVVIGSGTNQHTITNQLRIGQASAAVGLFTPDMELSCWASGNEFTVCGWGEAGYGYKLFDGATPFTITNEVSFIVGTNGPWFYSEPMTNSRFFKTNIIDEPAG